ncbi:MULTISPECIES: hypothetical protein [unclassified Chryseobacterium]|uniref:hypothetical protein n=1 Tax=unclassified Chryseobacterium TaxID=2593645 RepID=UPI0012C39282|nr:MULTISPECIES: hypothetical protein [unclassified Chryseobacterium]MPS64564.1 hypothetical protein [Chryseobacterium sp.]UMQ42537.1 hypothetical protein MKS83_02340 [Chryseobacterium sp. Y16C]
MKILSFLICIPIFHFGQLSPKVNKLYQRLSESDKVESQQVGDFFGESPVYRCFLDISDIATDKELEYMAYNGNPVVKTYASKSIFRRKLKSLDNLFDYYLKNNDSVSILEGCIGSDSFLADELYKYAFREKMDIDNMKWREKHQDSIIKSGGKVIDEIYEKQQPVWKEKEIDSLLVQFEYAILNDKSSPKHLVEIVAEYSFYTDRKIPYFQKLIYFDEKYNSEMIKQYMEFCSK